MRMLERKTRMQHPCPQYRGRIQSRVQSQIHGQVHGRIQGRIHPHDTSNQCTWAPTRSCDRCCQSSLQPIPFLSLSEKRRNTNTGEHSLTHQTQLNTSPKTNNAQHHARTNTHFKRRSFFFLFPSPFISLRDDTRGSFAWNQEFWDRGSVFQRLTEPPTFVLGFIPVLVLLLWFLVPEMVIRVGVLRRRDGFLSLLYYRVRFLFEMSFEGMGSV